MNNYIPNNQRSFECTRCGTRTKGDYQGLQHRQCPNCHWIGHWRETHSRPITEAIHKRVERWTIGELSKERWQVRTCPVTGIQWQSPSLWLVYGKAGQGKSYLTSQIASQVPSLLYVPTEEIPGKSMVRRFAVAGLINTHPDAVVIPATNVQQMAQYIERECCVVIDSVTYSKLLPTDLTALLRSGPSLLIGTLQATKDGQFRGSNEFAHEADVIIKVDQGEWEIMKNRYGSVGGTGEVRFQ